MSAAKTRWTSRRGVFASLLVLVPLPCFWRTALCRQAEVLHNTVLKEGVTQGARNRVANWPEPRPAKGAETIHASRGDALNRGDTGGRQGRVCRQHRGAASVQVSARGESNTKRGPHGGTQEAAPRHTHWWGTAVFRRDARAKKRQYGRAPKGQYKCNRVIQRQKGLERGQHWSACLAQGKEERPKILRPAVSFGAWVEPRAGKTASRAGQAQARRPQRAQHRRDCEAVFTCFKTSEHPAAWQSLERRSWV